MTKTNRGLNKVKFEFSNVAAKQEFCNKLAGMIATSKNATKTANLWAKTGMLVTFTENGVGVYCPISYNGGRQLRAVQSSASFWRGKLEVRSVNRPALPKIATVAQRDRKVHDRADLVEGLRSCR